MIRAHARDDPDAFETMRAQAPGTQGAPLPHRRGESRRRNLSRITPVTRRTRGRNPLRVALVVSACRGGIGAFSRAAARAPARQARRHTRRGEIRIHGSRSSRAPTPVRTSQDVARHASEPILYGSLNTALCLRWEGPDVKACRLHPGTAPNRATGSEPSRHRPALKTSTPASSSKRPPPMRRCVSAGVDRVQVEDGEPTTGDLPEERNPLLKEGAFLLAVPGTRVTPGPWFTGRRAHAGGARRKNSG